VKDSLEWSHGAMEIEAMEIHLRRKTWRTRRSTRRGCAILKKP